MEFHIRLDVISVNLLGFLFCIGTLMDVDHSAGRARRPLYLET